MWRKTEKKLIYKNVEEFFFKYGWFICLIVLSIFYYPHLKCLYRTVLTTTLFCEFIYKNIFYSSHKSFEDQLTNTILEPQPLLAITHTPSVVVFHSIFPNPERMFIFPYKLSPSVYSSRYNFKPVVKFVRFYT